MLPPSFKFAQSMDKPQAILVAYEIFYRSRPKVYGTAQALI